jgi:hydrogenase/urease accessory protein HupE
VKARNDRLTLALTAALAIVALPAAALAHEVGLSRGEYRVAGAGVEAELIWSRRELAGLVASLDPDGDGVVTADDVARAKGDLERAIVPRVEVTGDGARCPGALGDARLLEEDGVSLRVSFACGARPSKLAIAMPLLAYLPFGHRHVARVDDGVAPSEAVLHRKAPSVERAIGEGAAPLPAQGLGDVAWSFFVSGIEHILTGVDHLAFLFGLVLIGGRMRSILAMVTAFTVAHSITLGLAVLGVWAPSPSIVEPAIALSVAYVGVENWFVKDPSKRWRITFPFGLVHGFGFAGALGQIELPRPQIPAALATFNLGVEAGQLAMLALVLPVVLLARRREGFRTSGVKALSGLVAIAGGAWFVERVASL